MKKVLGITAAAMLMAGPALATANDVGFIGLSYVELEQNDRFFGESRFDTGELFARIGGHINPYLSTEFRVGATVSDKSGGDIKKYRFAHHVGGYLNMGYRFGPVRPYLLLGYTFGKERISFEADAGGGSGSRKIDDVSFGGGVDVNIGERFGINAELTQYYEEGPVTYKGPSLGFYYRY